MSGAEQHRLAKQLKSRSVRLRINFLNVNKLYFICVHVGGIDMRPVASDACSVPFMILTALHSLGYGIIKSL